MNNTKIVSMILNHLFMIPYDQLSIVQNMVATLILLSW